MTEEPEIPDPLLEAYLASTYHVDESPVGGFDFKIGEQSPDADALCAKHGVENWGFITPWNPRSEPLPLEENAARFVELLKILERWSLKPYRGRGIGPDRTWTPEESVFVPGLTREWSTELGVTFEQYAVVYGERGRKAELLKMPLRER